jgi:phage shock protein A
MSTVEELQTRIRQLEQQLQALDVNDNNERNQKKLDNLQQMIIGKQETLNMLLRQGAQSVPSSLGKI